MNPKIVMTDEEFALLRMKLITERSRQTARNVSASENQPPPFEIQFSEVSLSDAIELHGPATILPVGQ